MRHIDADVADSDARAGHGARPPAASAMRPFPVPVAVAGHSTAPPRTAGGPLAPRRRGAPSRTASPTLEPLRKEFGWLHGRTAEVLSSLDDDHRLIGACTGAANPAVLQWVAEQLQVERGQTVLDLGVGLGGPASWIARHTGARVVGVDALVESVAGMRRLFPSVPGVAARIEELPLAGSSVDHVIAVGVLDQIHSLSAVAEAVARVLRPTGRFVAAFFVSDLSVAGGPEANRFRPAGAHLHPFHDAGFDHVLLESFPDLPPPPDLWRRVRAAVDQAVEDRFGHDVRHRVAAEQRERFRALEASGVISLRGLTATRTAG